MVDLLVATIAGLCVDTVQLKHTFTQVTDQMDKNILPAVGLIASQSVELALKAYLIRQGYSEQKLRALGHDLTDSWKEVSICGLRLDWESKFSVDVLSLSHDKPYLFRYPEDKVAVGTTEPSVLCEDIEKIIKTVELEISERL